MVVKDSVVVEVVSELVVEGVVDSVVVVVIPWVGGGSVPWQRCRSS